MAKSVQIELDLFVDIYRYFSENSEQEPEIFKALDEKLDKMINRELFTKYKRATTPEEREYFRKKYLEQRGFLPDFISDTETSFRNL